MNVDVRTRDGEETSGFILIAIIPVVCVSDRMNSTPGAFSGRHVDCAGVLMSGSYVWTPGVKHGVGGRISMSISLRVCSHVRSHGCQTSDTAAPDDEMPGDWEREQGSTMNALDCFEPVAHHCMHHV